MRQYLGVTLAYQIYFDEERVIRELNEALNKIVSTTTPTLTYSFQTVPIEKLKEGLLENIDKVIQHAVKDIL